jgi:hypothetical protein
MPSQIVVSRRIYVPALIVAALLIVLVLGSSFVRAQGGCEYVTYTNVCIRPFGIMRVVASPDDCTDREVSAALVNRDFFECALYGMEARFELLEQRVTDLENQLGP